MKNISLGSVTAMAVASAAHGATMYVHDAAGILATVETTTGAVSVIGDMGAVMTDIAFDPSGNLFGITFSDLYTINPNTAESFLIGMHGIAGGNGLVFGTDGTLYASGIGTSSLYALDTTTGGGTALGDTGYFSSGDLAFVGDRLFLSSTGGQLVSLDLDDLTSSSAVGSFGVSAVFGIATDADDALFAVAGTSLYSVDEATGAASGGVSFAGQGLGTAFGQSFFAEAGADPDDDPNLEVVPVPAGLPLLLSAFVALGLLRRRKAR